MVILDEAHKARTSRETRRGHSTATRNNLLDFLHKVAQNATNVILGTATPIQLDAVELWDVLAALGQGAPQVLGTPFDGGEWMRDQSIRFLTGERPWPAERGLFRNPLPPAAEHAVFRHVRNDGRLDTREILGPRFDELGPDVRDDFLQEFTILAERRNPIVRRVVRRTRPMLEERAP